MTFTLYNKHLDRKLMHPRYGLWCTQDLKEAEEMLIACKEYLQASNVPEAEFDNFVIWDIERNKEICE